MKILVQATVAAVLATALPVFAQQPYAGQQHRDLKSLSAEEVKQILAGDGMGYAKPAELNRHPGPAHVLELAERLALTESQRRSTQSLMDAHKAEARALGVRLLDAERALEAVFRKGGADEATLADAARNAAQVQGELRLSHLETHRRMRALLTEEQVRRYDELRGYADGKPHSHRHAH